MYNCIAIASFLVLGNAIATKWITQKGRATKLRHQKWSLWQALTTLAVQIITIVVSSYLIILSGYDVSLWNLIQLWSLRPRVTWLIGNFARTKRQWGYVNGALSNVFTEIFVCGLATVFLGRILQAAFTHIPVSDETPPWTFYVIIASSIAMLISIGCEMVWALWMLKRLIELKGKAEAPDMDSMLWIVRLAVPITATCSWLIWIAFLYAAEGAYCPGTIKWVDVTQSVGPVVANLCRMVIEGSVLVGRIGIEST